MKLPFTTEQFLEIFKNYNLDVWPVQIILTALALLAIVMAVKQISGSGITVGIILAILWVWMGIVYHIVFFSSINKVAYFFGGIFLLQGIFFWWLIAFKRKVAFNFTATVKGITGALLIIFSLLTYPLLGYFLGHRYPYSPTFGLPCPTVIFTLGLLLWADKKVPVVLIIIPLLWSLLGFTAAIFLGIKEDIGLLVAGILFLILWILSGRNNGKPSL